MLSDEEKEAIEYIKNCLDNEYNFKNATRQKDKKAYNIILNLIEKQDKIINEMADYICEYDENHYTGERLWKSREQVIEYFTKKVGE